MTERTRNPVVRVIRILAVTVLVLILAAAGLYGGWKVRKARMVQRALAAGTAAFERGDWATARLELGRYLSVHQDDIDVLRRYAQAQLAARPVKPENLRQAIGAYRRLLALRPGDDEAFRRLVFLYESTGNYDDPDHLAGKRLEVYPNDPAATVARAKSLVFREKRDAAHELLETLVTTSTVRPSDCAEYVQAYILLSELAGAAGGEDAGAQSLEWLDRAVQRCPLSAAARVQRAARRQALAATQPTRMATQASLIRQDLEEAERLTAIDPPTRLLLSEQWMALREYDRAAEQLSAAEKLEWATLEPYFLEPADWAAALYVQKAKLALLTQDTERALALAEETLAELADRPQRAAILPIAIETYVVGGRVNDARQHLTDYLEHLKLQGRLGIADEQVAWLRAIIARAENRPYEVIQHLSGIADQPGAPAMIRALLTEAYVRTGQPGRAARLFERAGRDAAINPEVARLIAKMHLARGAWTEALHTLQSLEHIDPADGETKVLRLAAQLAAARGQMETDRQTVERIADELSTLRTAHPENTTVRLMCAAIIERREGWERAAEELDRALAECREPLPVYRSLARLYASNGRPHDARRVLEQACERLGEQAAPWLELAALLADTRQLDEARATLERGLDRASPAARAELRRRRALLDILGGRKDAGVAALKELAAEDTQDIATRALLLELPEVLTDEATATALISEIQAVEGPAGVTWRLHEARLWLARPDWRSRRPQIETHLKFCLDADPDLTMPALVLGRMYEDLGDWASAENTYRNAFDRSGSLEAADRLLALLQRHKRFTEARDLLARMQQSLDASALSARRLTLDIGQQQYQSALRELELRTARPDRDPLDFVRLAWISYTHERQADRALHYLDQATEAGAPAIDVTRVRVAILRDQGRQTEAETALDRLVDEHPTPDALLLRAAYYHGVGQRERAERDYIALANVSQNDYGVAVLGEFYAQSGELDRAIEIWEQGLRTYSESALLSRGLAKAYLTRRQPGDRDRAAHLLERLEESHPDDTDLLWVRAVEQAQTGTTEGLSRARDLLRSAVQSAPARPEVYRGLCELAFRLNEPETARDLARRGLQVNPADSDLMTSEAKAELLLGNFEAARERARAALAADDRNLAAAEVALEAALRTQDAAALQADAKALEKRLADEPDNAILHILYSRAQVALGNVATARDQLMAFCETDAGRQNVSALLALEELHRLAGDLDAAERALAQAAAVSPRHPQVLHAQIRALAARGNYDEIVNRMQSTQIQAQDADLLLSAANALASSPQHLESAIGLCRRACELAPDNVNAPLMLGDLEYQHGNVAAAQDAYRAALKLQPRHPGALNNLAWILAESGSKLDEALSMARTAVALEPRNANLRDTLGFVLQRVGHLNDARTEYQRSVDLTPPGSPARARALFHLAQVCAELNDWAAVSAALTEALACSAADSFKDSERAEIDRLLALARGPQP